MAEQMAKECIQGKLDCMNKCDVFNCKDTDECENCNYCYSQGNFGEQKKAFETAIQALTEIQQYRAIGTVEELQALKEKSVAKKPLFIKRSITQFYACPHCSTNEHYQWIYPKVKHCSECGGLLDWE